MEERTMNKIPMKEIWEKLRAPFPQGEIKKHPATGRAYIPVESIEKRLNETVGMGNWDFLVDPPQVCRFGESGRESCIVSGRLILYDDKRIPIVRSTCGAADLIYPKDGTNPTSVANAVDSAVQDVFKRCAKRFGIARLERKEKESSGQKTQPQEKVMKVTILEPFHALPKGGAKVRVSYSGQTYELVFWQKTWEMLQKRFADRFQIGKKLNEMTFVGVLKEYRGEMQMEFLRFPDAGGQKAGVA